MKKVDKGFEIIYWRLSYRRKFIRTLWCIPFGIGILIFIWLMSDNYVINTVVTLFNIVAIGMQSIYNYLKWKKEEKDIDVSNRF